MCLMWCFTQRFSLSGVRTCFLSEHSRSALGFTSTSSFDYAAKFGRACVVFTGISRDLLDADAYFPSGVVVDLGEVRAPAR